LHKDGKFSKGKTWFEYVPNKRMQDAVQIIRGAKGGARTYVETQLIDLFGAGRPKVIKESKVPRKEDKPKVYQPSVEKVLLDICKNITDYSEKELHVVKVCGEELRKTKLKKDSSGFKVIESRLIEAKKAFHLKRDSCLVHIKANGNTVQQFFAAVDKGYILTDSFKADFVNNITTFKDLRSLKLVARKVFTGD